MPEPDENGRELANLAVGDWGAFGQALRRLRHNRGMSMRDLTAASGVNMGSISHAERGDHDRRPSSATVGRLDRALDAAGTLVTAYRTVANTNIDDHAGGPVDLLPAPPHPFVGRDELLSEIAETAGTPNAAGGPATVVLSGPGGVGKTSAAIVAAHAAKQHATAALLANLRGWDESAGPRPIESVLRSWCRALGVADAALGGDVDELIETWRRISSRYPVVAVADNALSWQLPPLLPAHPGSLVLVTTRDRALRLDAAAQREVQPLDDDAAAALLAARTGWADRVIQPLVAPCGGSPLALCTAAAQATAHWDSETVSTMAREFDLVRDEPSLENRITRTSYERLPEHAQIAWRRWALIGGPITEDQAAAVLATTHDVARRALRPCVDAYLLRRGAGGYSYEDTHRAVAVKIAREADSPEERAAAIQRGLTWLLHGHLRAAPLLAGRDDTPIDPIPLALGITAPVHTGYESAWTWTEAHWTYPSPVVAALDLGAHRLAWQLVAAGLSAAYLIKPLVEWDRAAAAVLIELEAHHDPEGVAWMHQARGIAAGDVGDAERAVAHFLAALDLRRDLGTAHLRDVGWSALNAARWRLATGADDSDIDPLIDEGMNAHDTIAHPGGPVLGTALRATLASRRGEWETAAELLAEAWSHAPRLGDPAIAAFVGASYSDALLRTGNQASATEIARATDHLATDAGVDWGRIGALLALSRTEPQHAADHLRIALRLAERIGDDRVETIRDALTEIETNA